MDKKRISVSRKRQITIPLEFFKKLGIENEVDCFLQNDSITIRPVNDNAGGEFAEVILKDLISQGYSGEELLAKFKETNRKIRPAVEKLISMADDVASGKITASKITDIFPKE